MIILLDTSTPVCKLTLIDSTGRFDDEWQADRTLARHLLKYLQDHLRLRDADFTSLSGIGVFQGPGSFTGLRIGLSVLNTIADSQHIPIVGAVGDDWQTAVLARLDRGENDQMVLPFYGGDAHITAQRK